MPQRRYQILLAILLTFGAITSAEQATESQEQQQPPSQPPEETEVEQADIPGYAETVIVSASKTETQVINAPAAVSVILPETIENSPANNYGDLLRTVPGINVAQTSARDINLVTRGATSTLATSQLALLDGRTLYLDFFGFVAWDFLPIEMREIDQIEVIRGPASAVWGPNAMTGVVNVITKTPRQLDGTSVSLGFGAVNRDADNVDLGTGTLARLGITHAQAVNDRWSYKVSGGFFSMDAFPRPTGRVPIDPELGTGGGEYPVYENKGTAQPKFDARVDYDFEDGRQKLIFAGGVAGTDGFIYTGIGPFDIQSGTVLGYGKVNYERDNWRVNAFVNILDGDAPALLALNPDGTPINFLFKNNTLDFEVGNTQVIGTRHVLNYGGNFRQNTFDLSIAPGGDNRTEGGFYIQDEIFLSDKFRWVLGGRVDAFSVLGKAVFSPRTTFIFKPAPDHAFRASFNQAFRAPSFVNSYLDVTFVQAINLGLINPALEGQQYIFPVNALGNLDLDEEKMTAYEIGYTGTIADRYTVGAAVYFNETKNSILFTENVFYSSANPPPNWPLPPSVLDALNSLGRGLPAQFTYLNFEKALDKGIELSLETRVREGWNVFVNYSWQAEPEPTGFSLSELNIPAANRFNAGFNFSQGRFFGNLAVNYTDAAFFQDVLDSRFHGYTEPYTMVNGGFGVRLAEDRVSLAITSSNLNNAHAQQHIFGDIIRRQLVAELKFKF